MRLIGNKSRLLEAIEAFLRDRGICGGVFLDIFSGTASVGRHFKAAGYRVLANDHLSVCYTQAVAGVEVSRHPAFEGLLGRHRRVVGSRRFRETLAFDLNFGPRSLKRADGASRRPLSDPLPLHQAIHLLNHHVEPKEGLIFRSFSPGGASARMYFTEQNARRIDGILDLLRRYHRRDLLSHEELHLLLSALVDASDRVANISGTYGAYLKTWQRNALQPLRLETPRIVESDLAHRAYQRDANALVRELEADVLYIDPPYTKRQYAANYHVLEIIAELHGVEDLEAHEASLYGKTGLRPYRDLKSSYCVPSSARSNGADVLSAMTDLILNSRARHVLVSYNEEGLLSLDQLGEILGRFAGRRRFDFRRGLREIRYRRFRSDSDRDSREGRGKRQYRVLDGRERNEVCEWLLLASRGPAATPSRRAKRRRTPEATR